MTYRHWEVSQPFLTAMLHDNRLVLDAMKGMKLELPWAEFHRFVPPQGYLNPNLAQAMFIGGLLYCIKQDRKGLPVMPPDISGAGMTVELMRHKWPVYALTPELYEALVRTHPPSDMTWNELDWPIESALFLVPDSAESRKHFLSPEAPITFSIGKIRSPIRLHGFHLDFGGEGERVLATTMYFDPVLKVLMQQSGLAKLDDPLNFLGNKQKYESPPELRLTDDDYLRQKRVSELAANVLAFMASGYAPKVIGGPKEGLIRPASAKIGRERDALFGVRWLGQGYKRKGVPLGGHHASPIVHWRAGCWRSQPYGKGRALRRPTWIEPTWVHPKTP